MMGASCGGLACLFFSTTYSSQLSHTVFYCGNWVRKLYLDVTFWGRLLRKALFYVKSNDLNKIKHFLVELGRDRKFSPGPPAGAEAEETKVWTSISGFPYYYRQASVWRRQLGIIEYRKEFGHWWYNVFA